jgi:hypothetical protein
MMALSKVEWVATIIYTTLYKIVEDPFEKNNLADEYPDKVEQLKNKIESWYPLKERKVLGTNK